MSIADSRTNGYRTILNTQHPVKDVLSRDPSGTWAITYGLCNGIPSSSKEFDTWEDAEKEWKGKMTTCHGDCTCLACNAQRQAFEESAI